MEEELEILQSIYNDDIKNIELNGENPSFEIFISPTDTDNDDENNKNLILTLAIIFSKDYPNKIPEFKFKNVRGVIDEDIEKIQHEIIEIARRNIGNQMLFEIIQHIRDFLRTCGDVPKSYKCPICLLEFEPTEKIIHLPDCYHYYHRQCLATHVKFLRAEIEAERLEAQRNRIKWAERQPNCPVCRVTMSSHIVDELTSFVAKNSQVNDHAESGVVFISHQMRVLQLKMKSLYEKQKLAGGIIENKEPEIIVLNRPSQNEADTSTIPEAS